MRIARPENGTGLWKITVYDNTPDEKELEVPAKLAGWAAGMVVASKTDRFTRQFLFELISNENADTPFSHICSEIIRIIDDNTSEYVLA